MRLVRFGARGEEKPGLVGPDGRILDLSACIPDLHADALSSVSLQRLRKLDMDALPVVEGDVRLGPCVTGVGKIICVGLNYSDHAAESGMPVPEEPVIFFKATTAISGPYDDVILPRGSEKTDWEVLCGPRVCKQRFVWLS